MLGKLQESWQVQDMSELMEHELCHVMARECEVQKTLPVGGTMECFTERLGCEGELIRVCHEMAGECEENW